MNCVLLAFLGLICCRASTWKTMFPYGKWESHTAQAKFTCASVLVWFSEMTVIDQGLRLFL